MLESTDVYPYRVVVRTRLADNFDKDEYFDWIENNSQGGYYANPFGAMFKLESDAIAFKLRWA